MTLKATPSIVTPTGVAGLELQRRGRHRQRAGAQAARAGASRRSSCWCTRAASRTRPGAATPHSDINGCLGDLTNADGSDCDIRKIVARLDNAVDLVISGHTHAAYNCSANTVDVRGTSRPRRDHAARDRPAQQGRPADPGDQRQRLRPRADRDRPAARPPHAATWSRVAPVNRLVDRTDPAITAAHRRQPGGQADSSPPTGPRCRRWPTPSSRSITAAMTNAANAAGEMEAGDLIADAQLRGHAAGRRWAAR